MITKFPLDRITENPWNERGLDQANVDTIAASIRADGLLQPPLGRVDPGDANRVQLAFGHHRLAAYRQLDAHDGSLSLFQEIPIDVRDIDDRTMARYALVENHHRADPSAIETARALLRLTGELHMTQAEAGQLVGLKTQSAVSHLTELLRLPDDVQKLLHEGQIAQTAGRALLPLMHFQPAAVSKIAKAALEVDPDERTEAIKSEIENLLRRSAQGINDYQRPWPIEWPEKPLAVDDNVKSKGEPSEIPACRGCRFAVIRDRQAYCLRKPCYDTKTRAWLRAEVDKASKKLGIPAAAPGEKVTVVFAGGYENNAARKAAQLIRAKLPGLRLAPVADNHNGSNLTDVTGSNRVVLVTVNTAEVSKFQKESAGKPTSAIKPVNETPAQADRRRVAEQELREERALERIQFNRAKADVMWLVEHTSELIAQQTAAAGSFLAFTVLRLHGVFHVSNDDLRAIIADMEKRAALKDTDNARDNAGDVGNNSTPELDQLRRQSLAYRFLAMEVAGYNNWNQIAGDMPKVIKTCRTAALDSFGIILPAGWDQAPIHHTPINCWECGRFSAAASGKLTQGDLKEGWVTKPDGSVRCPDHRAPNLAETFTADAPAKPTRPVSNKSNAIAQRATAQALALANRPNVHSHTKPAPKPSAQKTTRRKTAQKGK